VERWNGGTVERWNGTTNGARTSFVRRFRLRSVAASLSSLRVSSNRRASASSLIDFFSGRAFHRSTVPPFHRKKSLPKKNLFLFCFAEKGGTCLAPLFIVS
jgi:hypothetical protein